MAHALLMPLFRATAALFYHATNMLATPLRRQLMPPLR